MKFPKKLFVREMNSGTSDAFLACEEDCVDLADDSDGLHTVAVYELVTTGKLATKTTFIEDAKRKGRS